MLQSPKQKFKLGWTDKWLNVSYVFCMEAWLPLNKKIYVHALQMYVLYS